MLQHSAVLRSGEHLLLHGCFKQSDNRQPMHLWSEHPSVSCAAHLSILDHVSTRLNNITQSCVEDLPCVDNEMDTSQSPLGITCQPAGSQRAASACL